MGSGVLSSLYNCNLGGTAFQLRDCWYSETPVVDELAGRTGTKATLRGEGWIESISEGFLADALAAGANSFSVSGQNVIITGLGDVTLIQLLAAQCLQGGPNIDFEVSDSDEPSKREIKFTATANWGVDKTQATDVFAQRAEVRADGQRTVTRSGKIQGPNAESFFTDTFLPQIKELYPASDWVMSFRVDENRWADTVNYEFRMEELSEPYPQTASPDTQVVDGTGSVSSERNEQNRLVTVTSFDLLIDGDPVAVQTAARPTDGLIYRESMEYTNFKGTRLRLRFEQLTSGDDSNIMDVQELLEIDDGSQPHQGVSWPGLSPVVVAADLQPQRIRQSGFAIGVGEYPIPPSPLFPDLMETAGKVRCEAIDDVQFKTSWEYDFVTATKIDLSQTQIFPNGRVDLQPLFPAG